MLLEILFSGKTQVDTFPGLIRGYLRASIKRVYHSLLLTGWFNWWGIQILSLGSRLAWLLFCWYLSWGALAILWSCWWDEWWRVVKYILCVTYHHAIIALSHIASNHLPSIYNLISSTSHICRILIQDWPHFLRW